MMKIRTGDIYREQIPRYDLAKKFISENILDITYGKYTDYYKSKLLLDNGAKEIWSLDLVDKNQFISVRKIDKKGHILYEIKEKENLNSKKFDLVIAFNVLSITNDVDYYSKKISENLSDSGVAIISVFSTNLSDNISEKIDDVNFFRKDELENHLKKYFNEIDFFSQENINDIKIKNIHPKKNMTNKKIKSVLRKKMREFFLKREDRRIFYITHIQPRYRKFKKKIPIIDLDEQIPTKYNILPYNKEQKELFLIAVCRKRN